MFQKFLARPNSISIPKKIQTSLIGLSLREREVLALIAKGASNKEIAQKLHISERTVKALITSILSQFQLRDRTQMAIMVTQYDLI